MNNLRCGAGSGGARAETNDRIAERVLRFDPAILPQLSPEDTLAVHWNHPALVLTPRQSEALSAYTRRSLDAANETLPGLRVLG